MIRGIEGFKQWFAGHEGQYVIIGGTACDLLMNDAGLDFRATKDIDLVLIVEALDAAFGKLIWGYINAAGYEHKTKSSGLPQFYRFTNPKTKDYPAMIELFSRKIDAIVLPDNAEFSPLPMEEDISSLSAILLDEDYYRFLVQGRVQVDGVTILDAPYLIPFKAKAWIDLTRRKTSGEPIDERNIRKHKNDVFRLSELLNDHTNVSTLLPASVREDIRFFLNMMRQEKLDLIQLGIRYRNKEDILNELARIYLS